MEAKITRQKDGLNIFLPHEDVHSLRVALEPCTCRATKSKLTADIRLRLSRALARAQNMPSKPKGENDERDT